MKYLLWPVLILNLILIMLAIDLKTEIIKTDTHQTKLMIQLQDRVYDKANSGPILYKLPNGNRIDLRSVIAIDIWDHPNIIGIEIHLRGWATEFVKFNTKLEAEHFALELDHWINVKTDS
jgi:hypothetical protein